MSFSSFRIIHYSISFLNSHTKHFHFFLQYVLSTKAIAYNGYFDNLSYFLIVYTLSKLLFLLYILSTGSTLYSMYFSKEATFSSIYFVVLEVRKIAHPPPLKISFQWIYLMNLMNLIPSSEFCSRTYSLVNFSISPFP